MFSMGCQCLVLLRYFLFLVRLQNELYNFSFFTLIFWVQVVKRRTISDIGIHDELPVSGRKRPVRERLGNTVVDSDSYGSRQGNKRYISSIY
jgi:hypothetical protein